METLAVVLEKPGVLLCDTVGLTEPGPEDVVVDVRHSGISTGTERLLWSGDMPSFPGMGYPLIPGYEVVGEVVEAPKNSTLRVGETVFVPGANCYQNAKGLFGGSTARLVTRADRTAVVDPELGPAATLLALAATARHAVAGLNTRLPELIIGHGVLGRLLARLTLLSGGKPPVVWETNPLRRAGAHGYTVLDPDEDQGTTYGSIYDVSGDAAGLNRLISRLTKGGEVVLAGFYAEPLSFAFPPAFMREARIRVAAEWTPDDMQATRMLVEEGALSLNGLITHQSRADAAADAYETAFTDPACLKMILNWSSQ